MSGFGYGIGSFMEGLASGVRNGQAISNSLAERDLGDRRLKIQEEAAARDAANDAYNRSVSEKRMGWAEKDRAIEAEDRQRLLKEHAADRAWTEKQHGWSDTEHGRQQEEWKRQDAERQANAPLVESKRKTAILESEGQLKGAETEAGVRKMGDQAKSDFEATRSKSILVGKDDAGNQTYSVDGEKVGSKEEADKLFEQRHGSFTENYYTNVAPKIMESYIQNGQPEKADQFRKYIESEQGRKTADIGGRIMQSYLMGDMDGVNKHMNELVRGGKYMVTDGYDIKFEPLKDDSGKIIGLRDTRKNKQTGETFTNDYAGDQLPELISGMSNPNIIFEHGMQSAAQQRVQAAEERKKSLDTGLDMVKEDAKADAALRSKILEGLVEQNNNAGFGAKMTPEQMQAEFNNRYNMVRKPDRSVMPPAGAGVPTMTWGPGR